MLCQDMRISKKRSLEVLTIGKESWTKKETTRVVVGFSLIWPLSASQAMHPTRTTFRRPLSITVTCSVRNTVCFFSASKTYNRLFYQDGLGTNRD
jgi:hypothetical protein